MTVEADPYFYHPELRTRIKDPLQSFFRTFDIKTLLAEKPELSAFKDVLFSDDERNRTRHAALAGRWQEDLWVFGYGSLMWDPAFRFSQVRRSSLSGYARQFILKDVYGGRGTAEKPGLMAALDLGDHCDGLLFRIAQQDIETETEILWRREMVAPAYTPVFVPVQMADVSVIALTFVADHSAAMICPELTRSEQINYISTGTGFLGSSKEYLSNIVNQFVALGIEDEHCSMLLDEIENRRS